MPLLLRLKILLIPILLLFVPLLCLPLYGLLAKGGLADNLISGQVNALTTTAQSVSTTLSNKPDLFHQVALPSPPPQPPPPPPKPEPEQPDLYSSRLSVPIKLDGETDDWQPELSNAKPFEKAYLLSSNVDYSPANLSFRHLAGLQGNYLYVLFDVRDDKVTYRNENTLRLDASDHLQILIHGSEGTRKYIVAGHKPGWVVGFYIPANPVEVAQFERQIHGNWKQTDSGYTLELRIHRDLLGDRIEFAVADVDDIQSGAVDTLLSTTIQEKAEITEPPPPPPAPPAPPDTSIAIRELLQAVDQPNTRLVVIDEDRQVKAEAGELEGDYPPPPAADAESAPQSARFDEPGLDEAFAGETTILHYFREGSSVEILAAAAPVYENEKVIAVIVAEQTTATIKSLHNQLTKETISLFLITFFLGAGAIFLFSYRLSARLQ